MGADASPVTSPFGVPSTSGTAPGPPTLRRRRRVRSTENRSATSAKHAKHMNTDHIFFCHVSVVSMFPNIQLNTGGSERRGVVDRRGAPATVVDRERVPEVEHEQRREHRVDAPESAPDHERREAREHGEQVALVHPREQREREQARHGRRGEEHARFVVPSIDRAMRSPDHIRRAHDERERPDLEGRDPGDELHDIAAALHVAALEPDDAPEVERPDTRGLVAIRCVRIEVLRDPTGSDRTERPRTRTDARPGAATAAIRSSPDRSRPALRR